MTRNEKRLAAQVKRLEKEICRLHVEGIQEGVCCNPTTRWDGGYSDDSCDNKCDECWDRYFLAVEDGLFENARSKRGLERAVARAQARPYKKPTDRDRPCVRDN